MRNVTRLAAGIATAALVLVFAAACDDDDDDIIGLGPRTYTATMFASNEVSTTPVTEDGTGQTVFVDRTTRIDWTMRLDNISAVTMSHIHGPALPGSNAAVIFDLYMPTAATGELDNFTTSGSITGSASVSLDSLRTLMNNGRAYVNVHTTEFPGGAIRGQIVRTN